MDLHFQCRLRQPVAPGIFAWHVAHIPERGAKVGNQIELKGESGLWEVMTVGGPGVPYVELREKERVDRKGLPSLER